MCSVGPNETTAPPECVLLDLMNRTETTAPPECVLLDLMNGTETTAPPECVLLDLMRLQHHQSVFCWT